MTEITDAMVGAAFRAFCDSCNEMIACPVCEGRGYHHGFGEHGHDPDWCLNCGGSQSVSARDDRESMRVALQAALAKAEPAAGALKRAAAADDARDALEIIAKSRDAEDAEDGSNLYTVSRQLARDTLGLDAEPAGGGT